MSNPYDAPNGQTDAASSPNRLFGGWGCALLVLGVFTSLLLFGMLSYTSVSVTVPAVKTGTQPVPTVVVDQSPDQENDEGNAKDDESADTLTSPDTDEPVNEN